MRRDYSESDSDFKKTCSYLSHENYSQMGIEADKLSIFRKGEFEQLRKALAVTGYKLELIKESETDIESSGISEEEFLKKMEELRNNKYISESSNVPHNKKRNWFTKLKELCK